MSIRILAAWKRAVLALACASSIVALADATRAAENVEQQVGIPSKIAEPILYARSSYSWPFSSGPVYGTGAISKESFGSAAVFRTAVGTFDLTRGVPELPAELTVANQLSKSSSQHFVMQVRTEAFADGTFDQLKSDLIAHGGSIVAEVPVAAFIVRMTPGAHAVVANSPSIVALQPYQPAFKLSPEIGRVPLLDPAKALSGVYTLKLQLFPGESVEVVSATLASMGLQVRKSYGDMIVLDADRSKLAAIATLDSVFRIEEVLPLFLMSEETTTTIQGGKWNNGAAPYNDAGVDGGGLNKGSQADDQILAILDNGIQLDAGDLSNTSSDPGLDINNLPIAGHRKVAFYGTTTPFGGGGDLLGCDGSTTGGVTHGHSVAAIALGNATNVALSYGTPYRATDAAGNFWDLDGVAPKARLVAYDGAVTPLTGRCDDVQQIAGDFPLDVGDLYAAPSGGVLSDAYAKGARVVNFSWGSVTSGVYDTNASDIDAFLLARSDAMVFVSAGNSGRDKNLDGIPDPSTIGPPATAKNIIAVGASGNADDLGDPNLPNSRWLSSSCGPATPGALGRIAPLLMAPGTDAGTLGLASDFHCRSNDNTQFGPVECDVISGQSSTSFAAAAASGAGMLVRDYFAQGFYPDGTAANPGNDPSDLVPTISGALLKAILVSSAEWMHAADSNLPFAPGLTRKFRGNREQGFGRIVLTNALPLQSYPGAVSGLIVGDGGPAPAGLINSTSLDLIAPYPASQPYALNVCDTSQPLKIAIAWSDPSINSDIARDLDLQVTSPSGRTYLGNFFTDDSDDNGVIAGAEECTFSGQPWPPNSLAGTVDAGPWSLPSNTCTPGAHVDYKNNVEAVFLSPDSRLNGVLDDPATVFNEASDNQIEQGVWSVTVSNGSHAPPLPPPDAFSIAIAGGVCLGSSARVEKVLPNHQLEGTVLTCNDSVVATIDEVATAGDPIGNLTTTNIAARTVLQVVDSNNVVQDSETLTAGEWSIVASFGGNVRFASNKVLLTDGTAPEPGNGVLDVRDGQSIRVTYTDANPTVARIGTASISCRPVLASGDVVFAQFGKDAAALVGGGCEKSARGDFTFGFPDRYMDAGELLSYTLAFRSAATETDLVNVAVSLKAVMADTNSPSNCKPGSTPTATCPDPNRTDNPPCPYLTVLDSPKVYGILPARATITPSFTIQMAASITGTQKVDMIVGVASRTSGQGLEGLIAQREILNADEFSLFYSTDFPMGGTEPVGGFDVNNNEILEPVTSDPRNAAHDYVFETRSYGNMTATNPIATVKAPWNFDTDNGGFVNGLQNTSRPSPGTYAQWGEDENYNGLLDGFCSTNTQVPCSQDGGASESCKRCSLNLGRPCAFNSDCASPLPNEGTCLAAFGSCNFGLGEDRDPADGVLDSAWGTAGGCGWQTKAPGDPSGGAWHTGLIGPVDIGTCLAEDSANQCEKFDKLIDGDSVGDNNWWELLVTPVLHKVNQGLDGSGDPVYQVAITDWAWNMSVDIPDPNASVTMEFDTDINKTSGVELFNDTAVLTSFSGKHGAIAGGHPAVTGGFSMFARISNCQDTDGNGSLDRCGTAAGRLCNANKRKPDTECYGGGTGVPITATRGLCNNPSVVKRCTGNRNLACVNDADCNQRCGGNLSRACQPPANFRKFCSLLLSKPCVVAGDCTTGQGTCTVGSGDCAATSPAGTTQIGCGAVGTCGLVAEGSCGDQTALLGVPSPAEKCVFDPAVCSSDADCGGAPGSCVISAGSNREGRDNCEFYGIRAGAAGTEFVKAQEPYGLATPADDDAANGYCNRSDAAALLPFIDKSVPCSGPLHCDAAGAPYATVRGCSLNPARKCTSNADCTTPAPNDGACSVVNFQSVCTKADGGVDEYVQKNGPGRNYGIRVANGPDMRLTQLEDFYGDTGTAFQAAIGFETREPNVDTLGPFSGFGVAVDDMVISWKESRLDPDTTNCAGSGECATVLSSSTVSYEGSSSLSLSVTDKTPYDAVNNKNDCNGDGDYADPDDDQDCNNNGVLDVTVKLTSDAEIAGELAVLDQIAPGTPVYKGRFPYSMRYNSPGTLFVVQLGNDLPTVRVRYEDRNDGTGARCKNALEPTSQGFITSTTTVVATTGRIVVESYSIQRVSACSIVTSKQCVTDADCLVGEGTCLTTFGDDDGFADTNELNNLLVVFANKSGVDVDDLTATLGTNSPNIECITRSVIDVGYLADRSSSNPGEYLPFQFKVANVNRSAVADVLQATFTITVRSNQFDALTRATALTFDLDFNAAGGGVAAPPLYEDFELGLGKFAPEFLDANKSSLAKSDTFRCQYNDPLGLNSASVGNADCFLGFSTEPSTGINDWHVHTSAAAMGVGRAFDGKQSLHLGLHTGGQDTTRLKHIMSIKTSLPVNLGLPSANPELNFAQQVSFVDNASGFNVTPGEAPDRGVVEVQLSTGGNWIKLHPFVNLYDEQGTDDFTSCSFDPIDDGNTEDSFFDPADPGRRLGPSSTCYPEFVFVRQGQTDHSKRFDVNDIGNASDGPGLQACSSPTTAGCLPANTSTTINNPGTWVRPRFSLAQFAGRSIRIRFLVSSFDLDGRASWHDWFGTRDLSADDGWYIDDVHVEGAVVNPLALSPDLATNVPSLACGTCSAVTPALAATPSTVPAPGQIVTLSARTSSVDACPSGVLQFQFWNDNNGNGVVGDAGDTLLRDWTDNPTMVDGPLLTTQYGVKARCSTDPNCDGATNAITLAVPVICPERGVFAQTITIAKVPGQPGGEPHPSVTINWPTPESVDAIRGSLSGSPVFPATQVLKRTPVAGSSFENTVNACMATNSGLTNSLADPFNPGAGNGFYFLVRGQGQKYSSGAAKERGTAGPFCNSARPRDAELALDPVPCP